MDCAARATAANRRLGAIPALAIALLLCACGGGRDRTAPALPPAAEPAAAPAAALHPAGQKIRVGKMPEGIVVDAHAGMVAVAVRDPARVVLIGAGSGRVLRALRIAAPPRHLELAGGSGPLLAPAEPVDQLIEVNLPGSAVQSIEVGVHPHDAAVAAGRVFVSNEFGRSVSVLAGRRAITQIAGFVQPGGLAVAGPDLAVVDVRADTVTLIDARSLRVLGKTPAGAGPTHIVAGGGRLFVADTRGNALLVFATQPTLRLVSRLALAGAPYGIAVDRAHRRLWVTLTANNELAELAIEGPTLRPVASYPTGRQPNTVAVDPIDGRVFVADAGAGVVQLINPQP
jgi:DNA-binding beta-propeller fold protein YncE